MRPGEEDQEPKQEIPEAERDGVPLERLPKRRSERGARRLLHIGALVTLLGVLLAVSGDDNLGRWFTLLGVAVLVAGLHRFGRLGPDRPLELSSRAPSSDAPAA